MWMYTKLIAWGVVWLFVWIASSPFRFGRQNCLTWAVERWAQDGGYLVIRWCRSNRVQWIQWPHFLWLDTSKHKQLEHIIPIPEQDDDKRLAPKLWFDYVRIVGDDEDVKEN